MNHTPLPACGHPLPALRGEGRERGDQKRFMAPTYVQSLEVFPFHEPAKVEQASCLFLLTDWKHWSLPNYSATPAVAVLPVTKGCVHARSNSSLT